MIPIRYLILDRDGTLIRDKHYLSDPQGVEFFPGVMDAFKRLAGRGLEFYIVTNQSGIGRGYFSEEDYQACALRLEQLLAEAGVSLAGAAFCPHAPEEHCSCRKPSIGMWKQLQEKFDLQPGHGVMIGDKQEDVAFGKAAGLERTILVRTGHGDEHARKMGLPALDEPFMVLEQSEIHWPSAQARDIVAAADLIENWLGQGASL